MKKLYLLTALLLLLLLVACDSPTEKSSFENFIDWYSTNLPTQVTSDNTNFFKNAYWLDDEMFEVTYNSDDEYVFSNSGKVYFHEDAMSADVNITFLSATEIKTLSFTINVAAASPEEILIDCANTFTIEKTDKEYTITYTLPTKINYGDTKIKCSWVSKNKSIISSNGVLNYPDEETEVELVATFSYEDESYEHSYFVKAQPLDDSDILSRLSNISIPSEAEEDINLPAKLTINASDFPITWNSNNPNAINSNGKLQFVSENTTVKLTASITIVNKTISKEFIVIAKPMSGLAAIGAVEDRIIVPTIISNDYLLITSLEGVSISWSSSDPNVISNSGVINKNNTSFKPIKLTATLKAGSSTKTIEFDTQVSYQSHMFLDRTFEGEKVNTIIKNGKLVLEDGKKSGTYTTNIIECANFIECVGSYSATSSTTEICELKVRMRIGGTWSTYFTYGEFGKGLHNGHYNQTDTKSKMVEDEIKVTSGAADAFQLQLTLKRSNTSETGPVVSLLALSLDYSTHNYSVSIDGLPSEVKYDVPKLYQHDVPTIGGSICSITSSTMLMMYRGYSFAGLATYPHQYMAEILKDYGHNIYGNWSYNCIGMGSFGAISYVKRFYSYNEIIHHLCYVGPISASIKGTFVTDAKTYTTNGHLIVITGYKIEGNNTYFYINDPNIYGVSTRCTLQALTNVNRMVSYIVE